MSLEAALVENTTALREMQTLFAKFLATANSVSPKLEAPKPVQALAPVASLPTATATAAPKQTADAPTPTAQSAVPAAPALTAAIDAPVVNTIGYPVVANKINEWVPKDKPRVLAALAKFGAKKGPDLKPEQYAAFLEELE